MPKFPKSDGFKMKRGSSPVFKHLGSSKSNPKPGDSPVEAWDWSSAGKGAGTGAKWGAALGTVIPGLGNVVGGLAGGLVGGVAGGFSGGAEAKKEETKRKVSEMNDDKKNELLANAAMKQERESASGYGGTTTPELA